MKLCLWTVLLQWKELLRLCNGVADLTHADKLVTWWSWQVGMRDSHRTMCKFRITSDVLQNTHIHTLHRCDSAASCKEHAGDFATMEAKMLEGKAYVVWRELFYSLNKQFLCNLFFLALWQNMILLQNLSRLSLCIYDDLYSSSCLFVCWGRIDSGSRIHACDRKNQTAKLLKFNMKLLGLKLSKINIP